MLSIIPKPISIKENEGTYSFSSTVDYDIKIDDNMKTEEYILLVTKNNISIIAGSDVGVFYAKQTIKQIEYNGNIPCCEIIDYPRYSYRGFMLDVARHFVGVLFIKHYIDILSYFKLNIFHLHLSDDQGFRVDLESYPLLKNANIEESKMKTPKHYQDESYLRGYYTKSELKDIVAYAKEKHITVIPEIDMPGHLSAVLNQYPQFSCDGKKCKIVQGGIVSDGIGCVANPEFIEFAKNVIKEISGIFPGKYIHLGGDEVPSKNWENCPKCKSLMKEQGFDSYRKLQAYFTNILAIECKELGKTPICWNDYIDDETSMEIVSQYWTTELSKKGKNRRIQMLNQLDKGRIHIMSDHSFAYFDMPYVYNTIKNTYEYDPIDMISQKNKDYHSVQNILGIQSNLWTEYIYDKKRLDYQLFPRLIAFSEAAWTSEKNYFDFQKRYKLLFPKLCEMDIVPINISYYRDSYSKIHRLFALAEFYVGKKESKGMKAYLKYIKKNKK